MARATETGRKGLQPYGADWTLRGFFEHKHKTVYRVKAYKAPHPQRRCHVSVGLAECYTKAQPEVTPLTTDASGEDGAVARAIMI